MTRPGVHPLERGNSLKWVRGHISKNSGRVSRDFHAKWPGIPVMKASFDEKGVAVFENVPPGKYHVASFAYMRRLYHRNGRYRQNPNWRILYNYHVWIWDLPADVAPDVQVSINLDDLNNSIGGYF